jgi:outer membrane protein assembly factor BamA
MEKITKYSVMLVGILLFSSFFFSQSLRANECIPWKAGQATREGFVIGEISIETKNVFDITDKKKNASLLRAANKLHIETKPAVIRQQLLFATGEAFNQHKLSESERILRANRYIKEASVTPTERCGNQINIKVTTRDNWTLTPGIYVGHSNDRSTSGIKIKEHNLLGLGKSLAISYKQDGVRDSRFISYSDPLLGGTRKRLSASIQDNSDGKGHMFSLDLPFYAFDSRRAWGLKTSNQEQETAVYDQGVVTENIAEKKDSHSLFYGWSKGREDDHVSRYKVGWHYEETRYSPTTSTTSTLTPSIVQSYPWIEYEHVQENYIKKTNFKLMGTTEDVALGSLFNVSAGFLHSGLGSDAHYLRLSSFFSKGFALKNNDLAFLAVRGTSYLGDGVLKGEQVSLKGEWYSFNEKGNNYFVSTRLIEASNLQANEQVLLGNDHGLRGYPIAYQSGNKSALITVEKRIHFDWYPLKLAKFGMAAFADVGTAWGEGNKAEILADVGIGLRIVPTSFSAARTIHLDLAAPLIEGDKEVDDYQFLLEVKESF